VPKLVDDLCAFIDLGRGHGCRNRQVVGDFQTGRRRSTIDVLGRKRLLVFACCAVCVHDALGVGEKAQRSALRNAGPQALAKTI